MQPSTYFYKDKPLFGLDIGFSSIKVMQSESEKSKEPSVVGYGIGSYPSQCMKDGVIVDYKGLAESMVALFEHNIVGQINTRRVTMSIPASRTYTRTVILPPIKDDEIADAVYMEAAQYIPISLEDLYLDYSIIDRSKKGIELLAVAAPKKIIDSYLELAQVIGIEPVGFDTSILAAARLFQRQDDNNDIPAVLIDFGSISTDITVYDKAVIVTSTMSSGGDMFTQVIAKSLNVSFEEAHVIKTKYGMGKSKKQAEIIAALRPSVDQLAKEIQRMIRYHEERSQSKQKIGQIIAMGGGANLPGLSDYLTNVIRLPVRTCEPLRNFKLHKLRPPSTLEKSIFVTVAGLSLIKPEELFRP